MARTVKSHPGTRIGALASIIAVSAALSGCTIASDGQGETPEATAASTVTEGKLTIATGEPAFSPWVIDDDPSSGEGFESAVAYAVAERLGYAADDVVWVRSTFDSAIAPGAKDWDLNVQQFSITEQRREAVDFSSSYYTTTQAVVATADSAAADAGSVADLAGLSVGAMAGSTSYLVAVDELGDGAVNPFNNNDDVVAALQNDQIDAAVFDLPTAFYLTGAVLDAGEIVGQFPETEGGDDLAFVLPKGSALTDDVTESVDALREDGTLAELTTTWLSDTVDVPVLQ